ncbi:MAG: leucine-rich repeat domain-containing protein [Parachlamydiaceae bacterium]
MTSFTQMHLTPENKDSPPVMIRRHRFLESDLLFPSNLSTLHLSHCSLKQFPNNLFTLQSLVVLNLSHNEIREIPTGILPKLERLNLSTNLLTRVPPLISLAPKLKEVNLCQNDIQQIEEQTVARLEEKEHKGATFPQTIQYLNLRKNQIQSLVLGSLPALVQLKINGNPLTGRVSLPTSPHLQCLSLPFHVFDQSIIKKFTNLRSLEIYISPSANDDDLIAMNLASTENHRIILKEDNSL